MHNQWWKSLLKLEELTNSGSLNTVGSLINLESVRETMLAFEELFDSL
jgi:hypothetical protein